METQVQKLKKLLINPVEREAIAETPKKLDANFENEIKLYRALWQGVPYETPKEVNANCDNSSTR